MTDLIQRVVAAIIRQEGEPEWAVNPGNLRGAPWLLTKPVIDDKNFWKPTTRAEGIAGLAHLFALHLAQGNTLRDFIAGHPGIYAGFAPGADHNDDAAYIAHVQEWAAIPNADQILYELL